ncbi:two-pore potassium channel 1-like isoform X1 [Malania oleifera]|uniref:two-pore potassium channel 1-like isoform X1 n=1 Tax=Malania oleifera TaxID=397392 RepID=UPI0025ADB4F6|nr:two-pore potassium channel 1-like isoform X1 [Malania oleifera]
MAHDYDAKQPLILGLDNPSSQFNEKNALLKRRKNHRGSSVPSQYGSLQNQNGESDLLNSESIFTKQPSFKEVFMVLAAYLGVGALCFFLIRDQIKGTKTNGVLDALYFCIVTMTTVGYGDLVPNSTLSKLFACIFVFTGMALVGLILSKAADYLVEKQEILLVKAIHLHEKVGPTEILKEVENNKAKYKFLMVLILLLVFMIVGTIFLCQVEEMKLIDAFYCVCSTITTLGYGDESFSTGIGRVFAIIWILSSTICLAQFFLYLAEFYTEHRQRSLVKWVLTRKMTVSDLEAADLDDDNVVSAAEFIVYKLKELGKINQEDISAVMEQFKNLDVDHSGTITTADLMLSQS